MANTRTLPDHFYDKDYETNGIHRVPLWRIGCFALNNTATNLYMFLLMYISYYLMGFVGVGMVVASSFSMCMRIWDGVTDPFVGFLVDKTSGRFGKNRPFMVVGNVILLVTSFIMFHVTHLLPQGVRFIFFIVISCIYYLGYTCQCVVTKSAQSCLTNDPKQRPVFAAFDAAYNTVLFAGVAVVAANMANNLQDVGGYSSVEFFHTLWLFTAIGSAIMTLLAVVAIAPKDRNEFFGTGEYSKIGLKDYWDTLKNNRAIQMLVLAASSDKLAASAKTSAVSVAMFACIAGSTVLQGNVTAITIVPSTIITFLAISLIATRVGQKSAMVIGSVGGIIINALLGALWLFGDPTTMTNDPATGSFHWGYFLILHVLLSVLQAGFQGISGNIVIPMTADCADYEVYRTGKYVPGLMGTLFSFVDKIISSFAPMVAGLVFAACGFVDHNPVQGDIATPALRLGVVFLAFGMIILGLVCNLIAMKFYPLNKEKMAQLQNEIRMIKEKSLAAQQG
ncbi:MFS transporter [uncultured Allofournierella sp.]|uniref:MFS transporter n=1 Tax=uncultured Allofournierella sp. TaxID=1940258 RepID=UPI003750A502